MKAAPKVAKVALTVRLPSKTENLPQKENIFSEDEDLKDPNDRRIHIKKVREEPKKLVKGPKRRLFDSFFKDKDGDGTDKSKILTYSTVKELQEYFKADDDLRQARDKLKRVKKQEEEAASRSQKRSLSRDSTTRARTKKRLKNSASIASSSLADSIERFNRLGKDDPKNECGASQRAVTLMKHPPIPSDPNTPRCSPPERPPCQPEVADTRAPTSSDGLVESSDKITANDNVWMGGSVGWKYVKKIEPQNFPNRFFGRKALCTKKFQTFFEIALKLLPGVLSIVENTMVSKLWSEIP